MASGKAVDSIPSNQNILLDNNNDNITGADKEAESPTRSPWGPISLILGIELCERLTYYTINGSLRNYVQAGGKNLSESSALTASFGTIGWFMCLPGGILSDKFGLYPVILVAALIYVCGTSILVITSVPPIDSTKLSFYLLGTMVFVCVGMGGIKPNIMNFGANQITAKGEKADKQRESFFTYFYLAINCGAFPAYLYFVTLATNGQPPLVPKDWGYFAAYLVAAGSMLLATVLYVSGTCLYVKKKPTPPAENEVLVVFRTMFHTARQGSVRAMVALFGWAMMPVFIGLALTVSFMNSGSVESKALTYGALGLGLVSCTMVALSHMNNDWLQPLPETRQVRTEERFTIQDVKDTLKTIPLILLINIAFSLCYNSMNAAMPAQACQMNCFIGGNNQLNGAFFNIGDALAIMIFAPLFENVLYPVWARIQGKDVSLGQKLMLGLLVVAASNAVAALLEWQRKASPLMSNRPYSKCGPTDPSTGLPDTYMNELSAFWMFLPFMLVGFGEILVMPSMYFYAYSAAPKKVRATIQAFNLVVQGSISGAFTGALQLAFLPDDLNTGNLNIYYYVNIAFAFLGIVLYAVFRRYAGSSRNFVALPDSNAFEQLAESTASFTQGEVGSFVRTGRRTD